MLKEGVCGAGGYFSTISKTHLSKFFFFAGVDEKGHVPEKKWGCPFQSLTVSSIEFLQEEQIYPKLPGLITVVELVHKAWMKRVVTTNKVKIGKRCLFEGRRTCERPHYGVV